MKVMQLLREISPAANCRPLSRDSGPPRHLRDRPACGAGLAILPIQRVPGRRGQPGRARDISENTLIATHEWVWLYGESLVLRYSPGAGLIVRGVCMEIWRRTRRRTGASPRYRLESRRFSTIPTFLRPTSGAGAGANIKEAGVERGWGVISSWRERTDQSNGHCGACVLAGASAECPATARAGCRVAESVCLRLEGPAGASTTAARSIPRAPIDQASTGFIRQAAGRPSDACRARPTDGCTGGGYLELQRAQNPQCTPLKQQISDARQPRRMLPNLIACKGGDSG